MKEIIKFKSSRWFPGSSTRLIYTDEDGKEYIGPRIEFVVGETLIVEIGKGTSDEGYIPIIQLVGRVPS
jgi:hypothetical protein